MVDEAEGFDRAICWRIAAFALEGRLNAPAEIKQKSRMMDR